MPRTRILLIGAACLLVSAALKAALLAADVVPFNADEAVVALMARHITQGQIPVFFYGQAYMGSLDALLVAVGFGLLGEQVWLIRLVQILFYMATLATTILLGRQAFGGWKVGLLAAWLLAIPTVNVTLYTTVSLGGYGEALLIGNLTLLATLAIDRRLQARQPGAAWPWLGVGFLAGLGLWAFGMTLVFSLPCAVFLLWRLRKAQLPAGEAGLRVGLGLLGGMIGALPWGLAAVQTGGSPLIQELAGSAIAGTSSAPWLLQPFQRLFNLALLGSTVIFGLRPPWAVSWLFLPLLPLALTFWLVVLAYIFRLVRSGAPYQPQARLLAGVIAALLTGFIFTSFGNDPSGRYFVPLAAPLALFAASLILALQTRAWKWAWLLALLIPAYHLAGTIQAARQFPPGLTTQFDAVTQVDQRDLPRVIEFLQAHGETYGYSNYWVAYPLAFFSQETLIYLPRLPYHQDFRYTERDDRYRPYRERVALAERVAYITTNHPALDERLRQGFSQAGINWQEETIGDFHIFYALSQVIHPQALGLGTTTTP